MKHLILAIFVLVGGFAHAAVGVNPGNQASILDLVPIIDLTATANATSVDMQGYQGQFMVILSGHKVAGTSPTLAVKVQDSADNSSFADVTGGAFTGLTTADSSQKLVLDASLIRRYVRIVYTLGGSASPEYLLSVKGVAFSKYPQ